MEGPPSLRWVREKEGCDRWGTDHRRWTRLLGTGATATRAAAGGGRQVEAVDFSAVGLQAGRHLAAAKAVGGPITWTVAEASRFVPAPGCLDLVLVAYLQLPEDQLRSVVTSAAGALVPGGRFLLVNHDAANLAEGTGGPQDPAVLQTPEQVTGWMRQAGLNVELAETRNRPVRGVRRPAMDCVVLAAAPGH